MKKHVFTILILFIFGGKFHPVFAQEVGTIYFGSHFLINNKYKCYNVDHEINLNGLLVGFSLPIRISSLEINYKVKGVYHKVNSNTDQYYFWAYRKELKTFLTCSNEILIGKTFDLPANYNILPQLGFGIIGQTIYSDEDGFAEAFGFYDLSLEIFKYYYKNFGYGIAINYENGFLLTLGDAPTENTNRVSISFIIKR